ncbi:hypothetical protein TNCV_2516051 [Trichonephila clavipes]|nr:hypothetical protein TNCV_2516051 [Trichonephila clavipes]
MRAIGNRSRNNEPKTNEIGQVIKTTLNCKNKEKDFETRQIQLAPNSTYGKSLMTRAIGHGLCNFVQWSNEEYKGPPVKSGFGPQAGSCKGYVLGVSQALPPRILPLTFNTGVYVTPLTLYHCQVTNTTPVLALNFPNFLSSPTHGIFPVLEYSSAKRALCRRESFSIELNWMPTAPLKDLQQGSKISPLYFKEVKVLLRKTRS